MVMMSMVNFYFFILFSMILSMSVNSSFLMWLSLELNMLSFLPIFSYKENIEMENSMKYFLIQSWASVIFLMSFFFSSMLLSNFSILMIFSIFMKLGMVPFHIWFISILKSSSLFILIFLSTIQKFIPLMILMNMYLNMSMLYFNLLMNLLFSILMIPSVVSLNKMLAVSSVNNIIWLVLSIYISLKLMMFFFLIYLILLLGMYFMYNLYNLSIFYQVISMNLMDKFLMVVLFMSLGGMPPLLGFLSKFLILKILVLEEKIFFILMIIFSSLVMLYYYLSRIYFYLTNISSMKLNYKLNKINIMKLIYLVSIVSLNTMLFLFF